MSAKRPDTVFKICIKYNIKYKPIMQLSRYIKYIV